MITQLEEFARKTLHEGLAKCTLEQQRKFKCIYSPHSHDKSIVDVIKTMNMPKLDWAVQQVQRTIDKNVSKGEMV